MRLHRPLGSSCLHREIAVQVRPVDASAHGRQQRDRSCGGMPEIVARADADECDCRSPPSRARFIKAVYASVVRHFQQLDLPQQPCTVQRFLDARLRVAGQHRVECAVAHLQHDAGVIRGEAPGALLRPEHLDAGAADPEALALMQAHRPTGSVRTESARHRRPQRSFRFGGSRNADPPRPHDPSQTRKPADVVVVGVRQDDGVDSTYSMASERFAQGRGIRSRVDQEGLGPALDEHRVALPDVEHDDANARHRHLRERHDEDQRTRRGKHAPRSRAIRLRPPEPHQTEKRNDRRQTYAGRHRDTRTGKRRHRRRAPGRKRGAGRRHEQTRPSDRRFPRPKPRARKREAERDLDHGKGRGVRQRRQHRDRAEDRCGHRKRRHLRRDSCGNQLTDLP